jgi:adenosine deaminase
MRMMPPVPYYQALRGVHPDLTEEMLSSLASETLIQTAKTCRDEDKIPIVALDIAGAEDGFPNKTHTRAFDLAHKYFFNKTVHAGEGYGPESILQAVRDLHAERIGHGFHIFSWDKVSDQKDPQGYVKALTKHICDRRINLEVCLTSNLGTMPELTIENHPFGRMVRDGVSVSINTDNRMVSNTTTIIELRSAVRTFDLTPKMLREIVINGYKRSFYHGEYSVKRKYIRSIMDHYDAVAKKHGIPEKYAEYLANKGSGSSELTTELDTK